MNCKTCREALQAWFRASMESEQEVGTPPQTVRDHAAHCARCAEALEAALIVLDPDAHRPVAPDDLASRIKERLDERAPGERVREKRTIHAGVRHNVRFMRGAAAAAVLLVVLMAGVLLGRALPSDDTAAAGTPATTTAEARVVRVEFRLEAPDAQLVSVVGDWNSWDAAADPLTDPDGDGVWEATITLQPGEEYQYQFLIDDQEWLPDPSSPLRVDDGFGGTNSVLNI